MCVSLLSIDDCNHLELEIVYNISNAYRKCFCIGNIENKLYVAVNIDVL